MQKQGVVLERAMGFIEKQDLKKLSIMDCAMALTALPTLPRILELRKAMAERLQAWLSSHIISSSKESDLAIIFCVLQALHCYNPVSVRGEHLAAMVKRLLQAEVRVGGPYASLDGMVQIFDNAIVAVFMGVNGICLPQVLEFLRRELPTLPDGTNVSYYLLLWHLAAVQDEDLQNAVSQRLGHKLPSRVSVATMILHSATQGRLGIAYGIPQVILDRQHADGCWSVARLPGMTRAGTSLFLTGVAAGLLHMSQNRELSQSRLINQDEWLQASLAVNTACSKQIQHLKEPLRSHMLTALNRIQKVDTVHEISMLPEFFNSALRPAARQKKILGQILGQANAYAWIAYVIYDDFMDDEGEPSSLPVANVAVRLALLNYDRAVPNDAVFQTFVRQSFDGVDAANAWEVANCRAPVANRQITIDTLPHFGNLDFLAQRTFIHALGPLALAYLAGVPIGDKRWMALEQGFRQYLIARQLNDDIHDWCKDLRAGHITVAVKILLEEMGLEPGTYPLEALLHDARPVFWRKALVRLADLALAHCAAARRAFTVSELLTMNNSFMAFLDSIERTVRDGLVRRTQSQDFLRNYEVESIDC